MCKSCDEKVDQPNQPPNPKEENISEECGFQSRVCKTCNENKSINDFPKDRNSFRTECKDCYAKQFRQRRRDKKEILVKTMGGVCLGCGIIANSENIAIFDFHHKDPNQKDFDNFSEKSLESALEEIKKCVLLCANCHRIEHSKY